MVELFRKNKTNQELAIKVSDFARKIEILKKEIYRIKQNT